MLENKRITKFFGEYVSYLANDEKEEQDAKLYLQLWKKFFLRKLQKDAYQVKIIDEQWIERSPEVMGYLRQTKGLALKIQVVANYHNDLENFIER